MKHINLKSIFATFLLLVGVCQVSWGETFTIYVRNVNSEGTVQEGSPYIYFWNVSSETCSNWEDAKQMLPYTGTTESDWYYYTIEDNDNSFRYKIRYNNKTNENGNDLEVKNNTYTKYYISSLGNFNNDAVSTTQPESFTPGGGGDDTELSIEGVTKTEEQSIYAIHLWKAGTGGKDYPFYKTNKNNYYMATDKWDMSSLTGFGLKNNNNQEPWIGGGGQTAKIGKWVEGVYASSDGILPTTEDIVTTIYFYYDGSNSALYLATSGSTNIYTVTFDANGRDNAENMPKAQKIEEGQSAFQPTDTPTAEGYTFGGWYTEAACTNAYVFSTAVIENITLYAKWTETKKIYVQGRFRVRESEGGNFSYTGVNGYDDWNDNSEKIQFIYDSEKKLYKLPTYCTTWELSKSDNKDGAVFHFKIGDEHWGATDNTNPQPGYTSANGKEIQATQNNFKFTYACTGGKNVVLWLDLENKKFWYEAEDIIPPLYALDGEDDFGQWNAPTYLTPSADYKTAKCTVMCTSRGLKRFNLRQVVSDDDLTSIGAIKCAQGTIMRRSICDTIRFLKEGNSADANPAIVMDTKGAYIFTYTYATKELTVKYPEKVVTPQTYKLYGDFYGTGWKEYDGSWSTDLKKGTWELKDIPVGAHMFMLKAADGNLYFNAAAGAGSIQRENTTVKVDNEYSSEYRENITLNADEAGTYTFQFDFDTKLITVKYPGNIKIKYRLVYAEQKPDGKYEKYHPSTPYINAVAEDATDERRDTVSLHVRCSIPDYHRNSLNQIDKINKYDPNPNNIYVYLQKWDGTKWETKERVVLQEGNEARVKRESGVYNFVVVQDPKATENKVYIDPNIEPYKGNYYIRTNVAPGGWNDYKQTANQITYSDYAAQHKHFDHYWCKWIEPSKPVGYYVRDGMANLKFTIANDYSNCVSDTCRDELDNRKFTINGRLGSSANVRWMWHSKTNAADRAYIAGGDSCLFFVPKEGNIICTKKDSTTTTDACAFTDHQNWTYKIDVTTPPNTKFAVTKKPHNDAGDTRYWVVGSETEGETLILGTGINTYNMRVVYDFKSDHLIYAWIPADPTITDSIVLGSTVVCMRKDAGKATQVTFEKGALNDVHEALGVLSLSKEYFWEGLNGDKYEKNKWEREWYWISFPFDVCVSDIFSSFVFGQHYIIQDYDGASRAKNGCWADSPSYWRTLTRSDTLKAGKGYVLNIGHYEVGNIGKNPYLVDPKMTELSIYFPSTGVTEITGKIKSVDVPKHPCSITDHDRNIYDSNWNLIGVPTWVNIEGMADGEAPEQPENKDVDNIITNADGKTVGFYYHFNTGTEEGKPGNTWTPRNVKEGEDQLVFKNMRSYLIQWAGTINWTNKSWDKTPSTKGLQARRAAEAKPEEYTLRLELSRGETALDQTFVRLQEDGDVTADYDMNYDMTKIINPGANLYSLIGTNLIKAGANVLPLPAENTTVYVPVGVVADKDGTYTYRFSMPDGTEGMLVSLADHETGMTYNLALGDYEVSLPAGTYEKRFTLEIQPKKGVTTGCNEATSDEGTLRKVLIDGNLYIQRGDALYDAAGRAL